MRGGPKSRLLAGVVVIVWAAVTLGLGAVGLVRLGALRGHVREVEHKTTEIIHHEVHRLELCSTAVSCRRLLDDLIAVASRRETRRLARRLGVPALRHAAERVARELAQRRTQAAPRAAPPTRRPLRRRVFGRLPMRTRMVAPTTAVRAPVAPTPTPTPATPPEPPHQGSVKGPPGQLEPPGQLPKPKLLVKAHAPPCVEVERLRVGC